MGFFASRLAGIHPSPIAVLSQRVRELRAAGEDVIDLGVGEPDFDTARLFSQAGALAALTGPQDFLAERIEAFRTRRDLVVEMLNAVPGLACRTPEGAFYVFPSCAGLLGKAGADGRRLETDLDIAVFLLEEAGVSTVPGTMSGMAPYVRLSTAADGAVLSDAWARIQAACARLT